MAADIVIKNKDADKMLRNDRRRVVTSEFEVAVAKLIFDKRADEFSSLHQSRLDYEARFPWVLGAEEDIPGELRQVDEGFEPPYRGILARYKLLCERGDRLSDQLFQAPSALQTAMVKQADYEIRNGQMVSAASAMATFMEIAGAASLEITSPAGRDRFLDRMSTIRSKFIADNAHLAVRVTEGGQVT